ncbi:hypothetical protein [Litoribacillus peritrichatus]|uniref:Uncharacterized protein n=1 Tax=Litoribacillus peritrichatus TaxID=718191 RepID=A0ABP7N059_9GAMM
MSSTDHGWFETAEKLLSSNALETCQPFLTALEQVKQGQAEEAISALKDLNELQYYLCIIILEIQWVDSARDKTKLTLFTEALRENVAIGSVKSSDIYYKLTRVWTEKVGILLTQDDILFRNEFSSGDAILSSVIKHLSQQNLHQTALQLMPHVNSYYRETLANTWSHVVLGLDEGSQKDQALMTLAGIGALRPMIQNGGEEVSAYGIAIQAFSTLKLDSGHPAVQKSVKGLMKLARHRAPKDVRAAGTFDAAVAAANASAQLNHEGWWEIATALKDNIWDQELQAKANTALSLANYYRQGESVSELKEIIESIRLDWSQVDDPISKINDFILSKASKAPSADDVLADAVKSGQDGVDEQVELRMIKEDETNRYYTREGNRFVLGCKLCLSDEALKQIYNTIPTHSQKEALVKGAAQGFKGQPDRVLKYLKMGYPEGDQFGIYTKRLLPFLDEALLLKAEQFFINNERTEPLSLFATHWILQEDLPRAARIIANLGKATSTNEWVPNYRRGDRGKTPYLTTADAEIAAPPLPYSGKVEDSKALLKTCKTTALLLQTAKDHWQDQAFIADVLNASKLKKYQKSILDRCDLIKVLVVADEVEQAIALLPSVHTGKRRSGSEDYAQAPILFILQYLRRHPEKMTLAIFTPLLDAMSKVFPQYIALAYNSLARLLYHLPSADRSIAQDRIIRSAYQLFRYECDHCTVYLGLLKGRLAVEGYGEHNATDIQAWLNEVERLTGKSGCYIGLSWIMSQIINLETHLPDALWQPYCLTLLYDFLEELVSNKSHNTLLFLEMTYRNLWSIQNTSIMNALCQSNKLSQLLYSELCRSMWKDIHFAPEPYTLLNLTKPNEETAIVLKREFIEALSHVMTNQGHPDADRMAGLVMN